MELPHQQVKKTGAGFLEATFEIIKNGWVMPEYQKVKEIRDSEELKMDV